MNFYTLEEQIQELTILFDNYSIHNHPTTVQQAKVICETILIKFQKVILCGEYYNISKKKQHDIAVGKLEEAVNEATKRANSYPSIIRKNEIAEFNTFVKDLSIAYLVPIEKLSSEVQENKLALLKGKRAHDTNTTIFQTFNIKYELSRLATPAIRQSINESHNSIFEININLAYIDEYLECKPRILIELKTIILKLQTLNISLYTNPAGEIISLLKSKAKYLDFKIRYRHCHSSNQVNGIVLEIPKLEDIENNPYKLFYHQSLKHYISSSSKTEIKEIEEKINSMSTITKMEHFRLLPFHILNRYINKSEDLNTKEKREKIENFLEMLSKKYVELISLSDKDVIYNRIAILSVKNILFNTTIQLYLKEEKEKNFETIIEEIQSFFSSEKKPEFKSKILTYLRKKIEEHEQEDNIPNYYLYKIIIEFFNEMISYIKYDVETIFSSNKSILSESTILNTKISALTAYLQNEYRYCLNCVKTNFEIMRTHEIKPVYLTMQECKTSTNSVKIINGNIFLHTSYILPNDFYSMNQKIESWSLLISNIFDSFTDALDKGKRNLMINKSIFTLESKFKENEFKVIQIVALFVSIATFVLGTVKVFEGKNGLESFGIILGLATCFILFNLFFHVIVVRQSYGGSYALRFIGQILAYIIILGIFGGCSYYLLNTQLNNKETLKVQSDSLKVVNNALMKLNDSLQKRNLTLQKDSSKKP